MLAERLNRRRLNRATLVRQLLVRRADIAAIAAVERLVGLQAQAPLAPYVALWSRLESFDPGLVGEAITRGDLIRTHAMRATMHLFSRRDAVRLRAAMQPMLVTRFRSSPFPKQLPDVDLDALCRLARMYTSEIALSRVELGARLAGNFPGAPEAALAYAATYLEPMVQVPPRGVWRRSGPVRWQAFQGWLGVGADNPVAVDEVVLRYLAAFGPASVADVRTWSGLAGLRSVLDRLAPQLRVFVDDHGEQLFDLPDAPRPPADLPVPVRFLPEYDNVLLSHADRRRVIPDGRPVPLPPGDGARVGTVLVDGDLRATWQLTRQHESLHLTVRATPPLTRQSAEELETEGRELLTWLAPDRPGEVIVTE